jgi:hypothetical protein
VSRRAYLLISCLCAACATAAPKPAAKRATSANEQPVAGGSAAQADATPSEVGQRAEAGGKTLRPALIAADLEHAYLGVIDRAGLVTIIEQGLGRVLARLKLSPAMERGKFQGFRVNGIDAAWAHAGIQANDVVLRLNGQAVERPEQAQAAFESLRVASELALELLRDGQKVALRYRIEGSSPTSNASAPP